MTRTSKRWIARMLNAAVATAALNQAAFADGWLHRPRAIMPAAPGAPCPGCEVSPAPPVTSPDKTSIPPKTGPDAPKVDPKVPMPDPMPEPRIEPLVSAALGDSSLAVGSGEAVNMFGDQFRSGRGRSTIVVLSPGVLNGLPVTVDFSRARKGAGDVFNYNGATPGSSASLGGALNIQNIPTPNLSFSQPYNPNNFTISTAQASQPIAQINSQLLAPGTPLFQLANVVEGGKLVALAIVDPSGRIVGVVPPITAGTPGDIQYNGFLQSTVAQQIYVNIANPAGGGTVGRSKISEDANPLPRDRVIFNYDYFNNTVLTPNGFDVHRIALGIEKTFFDSRASIEVRMPFASTLDSTGGLGTESRNTEFGNLRITPRLLAYRSETLAIGTGVGISLPTADDARVVAPNGGDFVRIDNETVILSPYLGTLWTPNSRFFAQAWLAFDFDTAGNTVSINPTGNGLQNVGRVYDSTLMQWDLQLGYWIYNEQDNSRWVQALAPFFELHYGTSVNNPTNVASNGFVIGDLNGGIDELNASVGMTSVVGQQTLVSLGAVFPLSNDDNRSFDYQIGVRVNYLFGPTAASRRLANYVP